MYEEESSDGEGIAGSICEQGDYKLWLQTAETLRQSIFARAILAASFASVLLELLQNRVILIYLWHFVPQWQDGVLKFALSVWGEPLKLMGNFNSTAVGLERRAGTAETSAPGIGRVTGFS